MWICVCMVLQKATRGQVVVRPLTWLYIEDVILKMDVKFLSNFAFSRTLFPLHYFNSIWYQFYIILGSDFHIKRNNATREIKKRVGKKKKWWWSIGEWYLLIPKHTVWFPYFPWRKLTSLYLGKENPMLLAVFLWSSHWGKWLQLVHFMLSLICYPSERSQYFHFLCWKTYFINYLCGPCSYFHIFHDTLKHF